MTGRQHPAPTPIAREFRNFRTFIKRMRVERTAFDTWRSAILRERTIQHIESRSDYRTLAIISTFDADVPDAFLRERFRQHLAFYDCKLPDKEALGYALDDDDDLKLFLQIVSEVVFEIDRVTTLR